MALYRQLKFPSTFIEYRSVLCNVPEESTLLRLVGILGPSHRY